MRQLLPGCEQDAADSAVTPPGARRQPMTAYVLHRVYDLADAAVRALRRRLGNALRPVATNSLVLGAAADLVRSKPELVAENALPRQQLIVLARSTKRPGISRSDRARLVLLA